MEKPDTRAVKQRIKAIEKEIDRLDKAMDKLYEESRGLERSLEHWEEYQDAVKDWRAWNGREAAIPPVQYCEMDGRPMLSAHVKRTCSDACRKALQRKRDMERSTVTLETSTSVKA